MKKFLWLSLLLLALPAYAQRGGSTTPLTNLAETCSVYGTVASGVSCSGYPKAWCVNYDTNIIYACDPSIGQWEAVGSGASGPSGGSDLTVSSGSTTFLSVDGMVFDGDFGLADLGNSDVSITVNDSNLTVPLANATGTLPVSKGGTGSTNASDARAALGAAELGANDDITSLSNLTTPLSESQGGTGRNADTYMTDNDILVYDTATGTFLTTDIPACLDAAGNHLNFDATAGTFSCGNTGSGGAGSGHDIKNAGGATLTTRTVLNFETAGGGSALAAADDAGNTWTEVTLTTSPTAANSVVGTARTVTGAAGLTSTNATLADNISFATASQEAAFTADGGVTSLTCTSTQGAGSMQVMDDGTLEWCDGAGTPAIRVSALGDSVGRALTGDDANNFFATGVLNVANGGTGNSTTWPNQQVLYSDNSIVGGDPGMTYDETTDSLTVGLLTTTGGADGTWGDTFRQNTGSNEPSAPTSGFLLLYAMADNLYNKDSGDSTNERLMLDSENVTGGDFTVSSTGVGAIGNDKITEAMLKAVDPPTDEECLSYESSVGDFEWQTCGSGGGGGSVAADAIWDAIGDLVVGTGPDTAARLPASATNGYTLVTDSAVSPHGLKWQAAILADETSPAAGHILVYDGTNSYDNKAVSGDLASISSAGAVVIADNAVDGTDIALGSDAAGDVMYYDGTNYVRLAKGTAGQVLEMNAGATAPEWDTDDGTAGGAPADADYLVGTANGSLSAEIVVGTTPGGELGGSWASPTLDDTVTVAGWTMTTATLTDPTLTVQNSATPTPTVDGDMWWEDDDDHLIVGDGAAGQVEFIPAEDILGTLTVTDAGVAAILTGAAPTVATAGFIGEDTTANQLLYGAGTNVLDPRQTLAISLVNPLATDDPLLLQAPYGMTITKISCLIAGSTNDVIRVQECNTSGASCTDIDAADLTCTTTINNDTSITVDAAIAAANFVKLNIVSQSGTPTNLVVTILYTITRE